MMYPYDLLVVGAGLYGACVAQRAREAGKKVLVLEKRGHIAGNVYTELVEGISVHRYGAHIFHTNDGEVWDYARRFADFNAFVNAPIANYRGEIYSLPFNMYTFNRMWGVVSPKEAEARLEIERAPYIGKEPQNLEEKALSLVGPEIYEKLIKGYTEKQWGRPCSDLPPFIITRLPLRLNYDNNYFNARYQGIPRGGYTGMVEKMLEGIPVRLNCDYLEDPRGFDALAQKVLYTGPIDAFYAYRLGTLSYRSLRFETETLDLENYQGNAVVNYTDRETPFTRLIEHKWFEPLKQPKTVISREYSCEWSPGVEPFYPVNDRENTLLYERYQALAQEEEKHLFGGRLAQYRYYDMDQTLADALKLSKQLLPNI